MGLGALGTSTIRPHLTVLLAAGVLTAQAFRPVGDQAIGVLRKAAGLVVLVGAGAILATQSAEFLGIEDLDVGSVVGVIDWASEQTEQGGSSFTPVPLTDLLGVPAALVTMFFRPFLWEARSVPMLLQSLEGILILGLSWRYRASLRQVPRQLRVNPYVIFAVVYALAFVLAFAGFGNFGILARQRTLMIPLALVMLALPVRQPAVEPLDEVLDRPRSSVFGRR